MDFVKKRKKGFRRIAGILAGIFILTGISHILGEMYQVESTVAWGRILWHHFYEDRGKIDHLFLGSSHVHYDLNPYLLDELDGQYHFNLSTPAQRLNGTYYLLREADRNNELSHVYLEMYYVCHLGDDSFEDYAANWKNVDYMEPSLNKAAYMLSIGGEDQYIHTLFPFTRYRKYLGDWDYVKARLEEKKQDNYRNYRYEFEAEDGNGGESYERQGYCNCTTVFRDGAKLYPQEHILSGYAMGERTEEYFRKIIEYCRKKEIPITLFVSPINDLQLISTLDYDDYITALKSLAAEYGIPFYDFNLAREEYLPIQDGKYFKDAGHLNRYGAELFTPFFYQVAAGEEADNEHYFYRSYEEKLKELPPTVYGIYYREPTKENGKKTMWIASNRDTGMEYKIVLTPEEGEPYTVQDFMANKMFTVLSEEKGTCRIEARTKDAPDKVQTLKIDY